MTTARLLPACFLISLFWIGSNALSAAAPNLVFIIADDCTFRDIGCYGGQAHTPNIDRLATEGMQFSQCHQSAPMCSPTRHNLYTGLYPVKVGSLPESHVCQGRDEEYRSLSEAAGLPRRAFGQDPYQSPERVPFRVLRRQE